MLPLLKRKFDITDYDFRAVLNYSRKFAVKYSGWVFINIPSNVAVFVQKKQQLSRFTKPYSLKLCGFFYALFFAKIVNKFVYQQKKPDKNIPEILLTRIQITTLPLAEIIVSNPFLLT